MTTELEKLAEKFRAEHITKNTYNLNNNIYSSNNPNALSDGDEKGKGELNGSVGSITDILTRNDNMNKNIYSENNNYSSNNKNALSDGDDKGKGELNNSVGSKTDILTRNENMNKNTYNSKNAYPNF